MYVRLYPDTLCHYGVKGMKWGVRHDYIPKGRDNVANKRNVISNSTLQTRVKSYVSSGRKTAQKLGMRNVQSSKNTTDQSSDFFKESGKQIKTNKDGSKTVPSGFVFNRVGKNSLDVNKSGGLYVSYGKSDAARYIKSLGPTPIAKLLGTASNTVQHIEVKQALKMPSDKDVASETANLLLSDKKLFNSFKESFYSLSVNDDFDSEISSRDLKRAVSNPSGKQAQKLAYAVSSFLGDSNYASESKRVYEHFRAKGYDAIPDLHDRLSGTSETAMIVINPDKISLTSTTTITRDVMKNAKKYIKSLDELKVSELIQ